MVKGSRSSRYDKQSFKKVKNHSKKVKGGYDLYAEDLVRACQEVTDEFDAQHLHVSG